MGAVRTRRHRTMRHAVGAGRLEAPGRATDRGRRGPPARHRSGCPRRVAGVRSGRPRRLRRRPDYQRDGPVQPGAAQPVRHRQLRPAWRRPERPRPLHGRFAREPPGADPHPPGRLRRHSAVATNSCTPTAVGKPAKHSTITTPARPRTTSTRCGRPWARRSSRSTAVPTAHCSARCTPRRIRDGSARSCWRADGPQREHPRVP